MRNTTAPAPVTICMGAEEYPTILVRAYRIRDRVDHLDSPASRSWTSNSTVVERKPIQEDIARKKAFLSGISSRESTARRSISLKSEALDMSIFVAEDMIL